MEHRSILYITQILTDAAQITLTNTGANTQTHTHILTHTQTHTHTNTHTHTHTYTQHFHRAHRRYNNKRRETLQILTYNTVHR